MNQALVDLPAHERQRLCTALETGVLSAPYTAASLQSAGVIASEEICAALTELADLGIGDRGAAVWLRTIDQVTRRTVAPDVVWSGPEVPGLHARDTRRVYEELLSEAQDSVWVSTYAFFDGPRAFSTLAHRMDEKPDLDVRLLLNIQRKRGDTTTSDHLVRKFADRFWEIDWPGDTRPAVFYDPRSLAEGPGGVLHAKAVVSDDEALFVTSANLTEAALDRNIELGLLVRDRTLALTVVTHFRGLIDRNLLHPLPGL